MAVTDWDTTAANNTSVGGVSIAEGWSPALVNNAIRAMMAEIATGIDDGDFAAVSGLQPLDATLTALAGLATGADQLPYSTGTDTFSQTSLTAFGRTLVGLADVAALKSTLGVITVVSSTLSTNGHIALDVTGNGTADIKLNWGTGNFGSAVSFNSAFSTALWAVVPFPTSLISQGDESDEHMYISSKSVSGFTATYSGDWNSLPSLNYIAIGK